MNASSAMARLADVERKVPGPSGEHAVTVLERGTLEAMLSVGRFATLPRPMTPHDQDEVYILIRGRGVFLHEGKRDRFESGDLLFVAAGSEHRFEEFTEDLVVSVAFYGPRGGEAGAQI